MELKRAMAINVRRTRHAKELTQEELADRADWHLLSINTRHATCFLKHLAGFF